MEKIVILNNIRSNENVGSIFRTADAIGVSKIILVGYTPAPVDRFGRENKGLAKASLGAEKSVEWEKVDTLENAIKKLKNSFSEYYQKYKDIISLENSSCSPQSGSQTIFDNTQSKNFVIIGIEQDERAIDYRDLKKLIIGSAKSTKDDQGTSVAFVFGNEVEGLSKEDLKLCDFIAELPMFGKKESLNVAVCAGIVLYSFCLPAN